MSHLLSEFSRLFRIPGLGGLSMAPVFGAISLIDANVKINLIDITIILLIGILSTIYGFIVNDYVDIEVDRLSKETDKRPLVTGTISKKTALLICTFCIIGTFTIIFIFFYRNHPSFFLGVFCIILSYILILIYNLYGKKVIGSDFLVALSEAFAVLFGALMISADGTLSIFTGVIFILVFNQFLFGNAIVNGIKDADHDFLMNVKNIALASGVKVSEDRKIFIPKSFKAFGLGIRLFSAFIVFVPFVFYGVDYEIWQIILLTLFVVAVLYSAVKLFNIKTFEPTNPRIIQLFGLQGGLRYSLVPIMLLPVIGLFYAFILIIFPLVWYIIFTPLSGKKLFRHVT